MASRFEEIMKKMNDNNQSLLMEYVGANFVTRLVLLSEGFGPEPYIRRSRTAVNKLKFL